MKELKRYYNEIQSFLKGCQNFLITPRGSFAKIHRKKKHWISQKEIRRFILLLTWATRSQSLVCYLIQMENKILFIWDRSGSTFLFKYLKECLRIFVRIQAEIPVLPSKDVFVKLHKGSLYPHIIPVELVNRLTTKGSTRLTRLNIICLISFLSIFRVLPTKVAPDISTIVAPFTGITRVIDDELISRSLSLLGIGNIGRLKLRLKGSIKAGPNGKVSLMTSSLDAIAFWLYPWQLFVLINFVIRTYGFMGMMFSLWLLTIMIVALPYFIITKFFGAKTPVLGRLSTVYDQAGKARIVGITNSWIQMALYPVHLKLMSQLAHLDMDGTKDQIGPFDRLLKTEDLVMKKQVLYGFDLSAATDRLPIDLQIQILNNLGLPGKLWADIIRIPFWFEGRFIHYSVGQPMGAYSSFAMLALTHHVVVQSSALLAGEVQKTCFKNYAVLGDDIVLGSQKVSDEYLKLIESLGMKISLGKSIISSKFTEFAKKLKGYDGVDLSPIGPGLILYTLRNRFYISILIFELLCRNIVTLRGVHSLVFDSNLPSYYTRHRRIIDIIILYYMVYAMPLTDPLSRDINSAARKLFSLTSDIYPRVIGIIYDDLKAEIRNLTKVLKNTLNKGIFISQSRVGLPDWTELLLLPILPSTYIIIISWFKGLNEVLAILLKFIVYRFYGTDQDIFNILDHFDAKSILDVNVNERRDVRVKFDKAYKLSCILTKAEEGDFDIVSEFCFEPEFFISIASRPSLDVTFKDDTLVKKLVGIGIGICSIPYHTLRWVWFTKWSFLTQ